MLVSPPKLALGNKMHGDMRFRILEKRANMTQLCEKAFFQHLVTARNCYNIRPNDDDGWWKFILLCREYSNSRSHSKAKALCAIGRQYSYWTSHWSSYCENSWRVRDRSCNSINFDPENTSYVVISGETERLVNEIHIHNTDARSSKELLEIFQEPEEEVTTRFKEIWADTSTLETRASLVHLTSNKSALFTRRTIPKDDKKWIGVHANSKDGKALALSISKTVTKIRRHFDQEERESDGSRHWHSMKPVIGKKICTWRSKISRWWSVVTKDLWRQYEEKNRILQRRRWILMLFTSDSRTLWSYSNQAQIDGISIYSLWLEEVHLSRRTLTWSNDCNSWNKPRQNSWSWGDRQHKHSPKRKAGSRSWAKRSSKAREWVARW